MEAKAPAAEVIRDAVTLACRAPSLHNSQPWRWVFDGTRLHLWADPRHAMPGTDHTGRELLLSCGAVLDHLRVAMAAAGWDSVTERFPTDGRPDHLATVGFLPVENVTAARRLRADAIRGRRTDRLPMGAPSGWAALHADMCRAVIPYDVSLDVVADDDRATLAEASRLTEQLRRNDASYLTELRWWTSPFESSPDHVPESALVSSSEAARVDVARTFPPAGGGRRRATIDRDHSTIVVLSTHHDDAPTEVLHCGEALSAVLLECTVAGMTTCTLTHMTELSPSRDLIRQVTGSPGRPQVLIRVGRSPAGDHAEPTARRPVSDVLEMPA